MKVYIFDLDGTVINSMEFWESFLKEFLDDIGYRDQIEELDLSGLSLDESPKAVVDHYDLDISYDQAKEYFYKKINTYYTDVEPKPGAIEFLKRAYDHGVKILVGTATSKEGAIQILKRFEVDDLVDRVVTEECLGYKKTDEEFFSTICEDLGVGYGDLVLFDDDLGVIKNANSLDISVVGVLDPIYPDYVLDEIKGLSDITIVDFKEIEGLI